MNWQNKIIGHDDVPPDQLMAQLKDAGAKPLDGFQLRYIYFIDPTYRARLTVPELPYSTIEAMGGEDVQGATPRNRRHRRNR